jgi:hypothetical protein
MPAEARFTKSAYLTCFRLLLPVLVLVFVIYNRRREAQIKYPNPDDDVRENIINYEDEGGGEDDMTAFDITPLQIPVASGPSDAATVAAMSTLQRQKMKSCKLTSLIYILFFDRGRNF